MGGNDPFYNADTKLTVCTFCGCVITTQWQHTCKVAIEHIQKLAREAGYDEHGELLEKPKLDFC